MKLREQLQVLQRVLLNTRTNALLGDRVQVNESASPKKPIDRKLAGRVPPHHPFECRRLVWSEVVDVHPLMGPPLLHHELNEVLERELLFAMVVRPPPVVSKSSAFVAYAPTQQVFEPAVVVEPRGFDIEEDVPRAGLGETPKPAVFLG